MRLRAFGVTRAGQPILRTRLSRSVNHSVRYTMAYDAFDAAVEAGATLTELLAWWRGEMFPRKFQATVVAWHRLKRAISAHIEEAGALQAEREAKSKHRPKGRSKPW